MNNIIRRIFSALEHVSGAIRNLSIAAAAMVFVIVILALSPLLSSDHGITEENAGQFCGWIGHPLAAEEWPKFEPFFPKFFIRGEEEDNSEKNVRLWDAAKVVNGGRHLPTIRQLIGDCVGAGATHAVNYLQCCSIVLRGEPHEYRPVYLPYHYAVGRNAPECGRGQLGRDPSGSLGIWQARAIQLYGVIPADLDGLPPYSTKVIKEWAVRMPDAQYVETGKMHLVRTVARVTSARDVRDAICNGYPVTIASDWGGIMQPPTRDGRLVNRRVGQWMHQMVVIAYDGSIPGKRYYYILNSWGPDAHGPPPDGSPPGGFWVEEKEIEYIVRQGDSFAFSQWDGFPKQDWVIIRQLIGAVMFDDEMENKLALLQRN